MIARFSHVLYIMNPRAGVQRNMGERVVAACEKAEMDFAIEVTQHAGHATELAAGASENGFDLVVAIGGDGTINEVARALINTEMPMGIAPSGSGNAFARALNISFDPSIACEAFAEPDIRKLDVGRVGKALFLSTAGVGLDAEVAQQYANRTGQRGLLPYVMLTLQSFFTFQPQSLRLALDDGEEIERRPFIVAIANTSQYGSWVTIAPGAVPDDGLLDVCVFTRPGWIRLALNAHRLFNGTFDRMPGVEMFRAKKISITRQEPDWFQFDGEVERGDEQLIFEVLPQALTMVLPRQS